MNPSGLSFTVHAALSGRMMVQLGDAVTELEKWERGVALILRGEVNGMILQQN